MLRTDFSSSAVLPDIDKVSESRIALGTDTRGASGGAEIHF